jgi:hypothetical protein
LPQEPAIPIEDLDAGILPVANIDQVAINHDRVGSVELPRPSAVYCRTCRTSVPANSLSRP